MIAAWLRRRLRPRTLLLVAVGLSVLVVVARFGVGPLESAVRPLVAEARIAAIAPEIRSAADENGLDPFVLAGLVYVESSGRMAAVSSADALGLCQLRLPTALEQAERAGLEIPSRKDLLTDPGLNLSLGAGYLARLRERFGGSLEQALMAYNTGPTRFSTWIREAGGYAAWRARVDAEGPPGPGSVRTYVRKVAEAAERLRGERELREAFGSPSPGATRG